MNIIELTNDELQTVLKWRDENKDTVRNFKPFLVGGRIVVGDIFSLSFSVFPIKERYSITIKYYANMQKLLTIEVETFPFGFTKVLDIRGTKVYERSKFSPEERNGIIQDMIGVFFAVNAYFLHRVTLDEEIPEKIAKTHSTGKETAHSQANRRVVKHLNKIYTIRGKNIPSGSGAIRMRHCEAWEVVGHYRHYKDGRVIYIAPYCKGKNKNAIKGKTYKV